MRLDEYLVRGGIEYGRAVTVLDICSSAGGFLAYAAGIASRVTGIEFSEEFREPLRAVEKECPNVKAIFGDAFAGGGLDSFGHI